MQRIRSTRSDECRFRSYIGIGATAKFDSRHHRNDDLSPRRICSNIRGREKIDRERLRKFICTDTRHTAINKVLVNAITHRSFSEWSMGFVGTSEIESRMPLSAMGIVMNLLSDDAKSKPLSFALNAFVSIYNQMRKSPYM